MKSHLKDINQARLPGAMNRLLIYSIRTLKVLAIRVFFLINFSSITPEKAILKNHFPRVLLKSCSTFLLRMFALARSKNILRSTDCVTSTLRNTMSYFLEVINGSEVLIRNILAYSIVRPI